MSKTSANDVIVDKIIKAVQTYSNNSHDQVYKRKQSLSPSLFSSFSVLSELSPLVARRYRNEYMQLFVKFIEMFYNREMYQIVFLTYGNNDFILFHHMTSSTYKSVCELSKVYFEGLHTQKSPKIGQTWIHDVHEDEPYVLICFHDNQTFSMNDIMDLNYKLSTCVIHLAFPNDLISSGLTICINNKVYDILVGNITCQPSKSSKPCKS